MNRNAGAGTRGRTGHPGEAMEAEVCVVGGGPAGSVCAKRLAELGHHVLLLERRSFPRPHVGEALTPAVWPLLHALGVREAVEAAGFPYSGGARVRWAAAEPRLVRPRAGPPGFTVDRGQFDHLLLDASRAAGARVLQPARAGRPRRGTAGWQLPVSAGDRTHTVHARFLVDASGRARTLGGRADLTGPRTLALHATWRGTPRDLGSPQGEARGDGLARVEAGENAWFWGAPLADRAFRAMAFVDPGLLNGHRKGDLETLYRQLLMGSEVLEGWSGRDLDSPVAVCVATAYADDEPVCEDSIKIGEAAFALDPLTSSGVDKAMQSAMAASVTVHTLLTAHGQDDQGAALAFYRNNHHRSVAQHTRWTADTYRDHRLHQLSQNLLPSPFWERRAPERELEAAAPAAVPAASAGRGQGGGHGQVGGRSRGAPDGGSGYGGHGAGSVPAGTGGNGGTGGTGGTGDRMEALLSGPAQLSARAALVDTPCAVGDRVELRRALVHPDLPRPVAFVDGVELAPLLDLLTDTTTFADVLRKWARSLPPVRVTDLARWLYGKGLLERP